MEISLTLSPHSIPRTSPSSSFSSAAASLASSNSVFFSNGRSVLLKKNINTNCKVLSRSKARRGLNCNCLFGLGVPELAVIAGVAALVFGPKKLPEVGKSLGKTIKSFQQAAKEFESELKKEPDPATEETPAVKPTEVDAEEKQDPKISSTEKSL